MLRRSVIFRQFLLRRHFLRKGAQHQPRQSPQIPQGIALLQQPQAVFSRTDLPRRTAEDRRIHSILLCRGRIGKADGNGAARAAHGPVGLLHIPSDLQLQRRAVRFGEQPRLHKKRPPFRREFRRIKGRLRLCLALRLRRKPAGAAAAQQKQQSCQQPGRPPSGHNPFPLSFFRIKTYMQAGFI